MADITTCVQEGTIVYQTESKSTKMDNRGSKKNDNYTFTRFCEEQPKYPSSEESKYVDYHCEISCERKIKT